MTPLPIEQQVVNRELSEQLHDLGVPQESVWYWQKLHKSLGGGFQVQTSRPPQNNFDKNTACSAFTIAELIKTLGGEITIPNNTENVADFIALKMIDKISDLKELIQNNLIDVRKI